MTKEDNKLMQELLDKNNVLMYSTHNEDKSVIAKRFINTSKAKIYYKIAAKDIKSYLSYFNNSTYHLSINKNFINADCSVLNEKWRPIL